MSGLYSITPRRLQENIDSISSHALHMLPHLVFTGTVAWLRSGDSNRWPPGFWTARIATKLSPILWRQTHWPVGPSGLHSQHKVRNASAPIAEPSLSTRHST